VEESSLEGAGQTLDVAVIGAGLAGIYALYRLRAVGLRVRGFEAAAGAGGTWYWNRYPGARCDVPILQYSYSFSRELEQEWDWSEHYASQPEIERYVNHVVDRFGLRQQITFGIRLVSATFDEDAGQWSLRFDDGTLVRARYCVMATGGYSAPVRPDIPGIDSFAGEAYMTACWPDEPVGFTGKRVGVIGTGASGIQVITEIASRPVDHLYVFQRTANYLARGGNRPIEPEEMAEVKRTYPELRERIRHSGTGQYFPFETVAVRELSDEEFQRRMTEAWRGGGLASFAWATDLVVDEESNRKVSDFVRDQVRATVRDPRVAELLCAKGHRLLSRRALMANGYLEAYNQPNVTLVDVKSDAIVEIVPAGIRTASASYPLDMLVLATGFDSGTGALLRVDIRGRGGIGLADKWGNGPSTYLGITVSGFPNLFVIAGPGSPSIRSNVMVSIEQHVDWLADLLRYMTDHGHVAVEATEKAEQAWTRHVAETAESLLVSKDETQYMGANIPGKPRAYLAYMGGVGKFRSISDRVRDVGYEGYAFTDDSGSVDSAGESWTDPAAAGAVGTWAAITLN
jgi:cyclohexanone monooxygenase